MKNGKGSGYWEFTRYYQSTVCPVAGAGGGFNSAAMVLFVSRAQSCKVHRIGGTVGHPPHTHTHCKKDVMPN